MLNVKIINMIKFKEQNLSKNMEKHNLTIITISQYLTFDLNYKRKEAKSEFERKIRNLH